MFSKIVLGSLGNLDNDIMLFMSEVEILGEDPVDYETFLSDIDDHLLPLVREDHV